MSGWSCFEKAMASQWCGCGAAPGANLRPCNAPRFGSMTPLSRERPPTLPGYGVGAHGYDTGLADCYPDVCADWPAIYRLPDTGVYLDGMDSRYMWHPPTSGCDQDPWLPWGYGNGPRSS